jgi:phosphoribosyl 1,2-cyclic phosphodiesterase
MSIELCILASGSGGNSTVVRSPAGVMLIDAGIGPRTCAKRLMGSGVTINEVRAICVTHLDSDHFAPTWASTIQKLRLQVFCHRNLRQAVAAMVGEDYVATFDSDAFSPIDRLRFHPVPLAHDQEGSHGFVIEGFGCRVGYATDLGRVPSYLIDRFEDVDILAIESNYDPDMQVNSGRPWFLQRRIMGGSGHLSNEQAMAAIRTILDRREQKCLPLPSHIVLLHRSRQCNCPNLMKRLFAADARIASRLTIAEQSVRTNWLGVVQRDPLPGEQLALGW